MDNLKNTENILDLIIIGARSTDGITAGIYAIRSGLKVKILEKGVLGR